MICFSLCWLNKAKQLQHIHCLDEACTALASRKKNFLDYIIIHVQYSLDYSMTKQ